MVGAGKIAETFHLPAWKKMSGARVVALCDPRVDAARRLAGRFGIDLVYPSVETMLQDAELDAVDICSPHRLHHEHALLVLNAGLHCLIEKPFATTAEAARAIVEAARARDRVVMCAQHQRFRPPSIKLKAMIEAGELGEIYCARVDAMSARGVPRQIDNSFTDKTKAGGGPLIDQGAHGIDIAWWLMGCPTPTSAFAVTSEITAPDVGRTPGGAEWDVYTVEDFATGVLTFEGGRSITIHTSYFAHCENDRFGCELLGTRGGAIWPELIVTRPEGDGVQREVIEPDTDNLASMEEIAHFLGLIAQTQSPIVPPEQSLKVVQMIEALYKSAMTGKSIGL